MKKAILYLLLANLFTACAMFNKKTETKTTETMAAVINNPCPEQGNCTAERLKDKALVLTESEDGREVYVELIDQKGSYVIHYRYEKTASGKYQDDFHTEELFFQIPAETFKKEYKDADLQNVFMVFGRQCYCKGFAGNFRVTQGDLQIDHSAQETQVHVRFKAVVPQLFEELNFKVR